MSRKIDNRITINLDEITREQLETEAKNKDWSKSQVAREILKEYFLRQECDR